LVNAWDGEKVKKLIALFLSMMLFAGILMISACSSGENTPAKSVPATLNTLPTTMKSETTTVNSIPTTVKSETTIVKTVPTTTKNETTTINSESAVVKEGDTVKVEYTGTLADGSQFDSNVGGTPLQFTVGKHQMISGFEKAVVGMKVGEEKKVTIPAAEAYGERQDNLVLELGRDKLASSMNPKVGDVLTLTSNGQRFNVVVTKVTATTITVDANHELAGKDLIFKIKILEIVKP
jgi:peptidylprolyl isomerase